MSFEMNDQFTWVKIPDVISLRDYFAAAVLSGLADVLRIEVRAEQIAKTAYEIADAMLKEREK